MEGYKY
jgi:hypothetical protein